MEIATANVAWVGHEVYEAEFLLVNRNGKYRLGRA
jgi:hypothetical protein